MAGSSGSFRVKGSNKGFVDGLVHIVTEENQIPPGNVRLVSCDGQIIPFQPFGHIVVLSPPAPVLVGKPVDNLELVHSHSRDSTKQTLVWQLVLELVHGHRHMARLPGTRVEISVIFRQQVHVVEH